MSRADWLSVGIGLTAAAFLVLAALLIPYSDDDDGLIDPPNLSIEEQEAIYRQAMDELKKEDS